MSFSDGIGIAGIALAIILLVLDKAGKLKGNWLIGLLFLAGVMTLFLALGNSWVTDSPSKWRLWRGALMFCIVAFTYSAIVIWISEVTPAKALHGPTKPDEPLKPKLPEVTLRFVYPKAPALVISNPSDSIARDIKWTVALWNLDMPDRNDPLPIPVSTFDWIRPRDEGGPQDLFGSQPVAPLLKPGNRLFGSAAVICPNCARGRTYVVYIVWGKGGWFSELENEKSGQILIPANFLKDSREAYFRQLETMIPEKARIQISERNATNP